MMVRMGFSVSEQNEVCYELAGLWRPEAGCPLSFPTAVSLPQG